MAPSIQLIEEGLLSLQFDLASIFLNLERATFEDQA